MKIEKVAEFKDRLGEALRVKNMKPIDLSEKLDIARGTISYYLSGRNVPKSNRLHQICSILNVSEAWMLGYDVPMNRTEEQKKNDNIVKIVAQMRREKDFFDIVSLMAELPPEQYSIVKSMILALGKK